MDCSIPACVTGERSQVNAPANVSAIALDLHPRRRTFGLLGRLAKEKPLGATGGILVLVLVLLAVLADALAPYGYAEIHLGDRLLPASTTYPIGTDELGRDLFSRLLFGARVSVYVAVGVVAISTALSVATGVVSGYLGGRVDLVVQRFIDALMAFPALVILISVMSILGTGLANVIIVLGVLTGLQNTRVVRGAVITVKESQYVEAARSVGAESIRIMLLHILPNVLAPIIILATIGFGNAILLEASLSFLGLGVPPPEPSWGQMLSGAGIEWMYSAPWLAVWPGVAITAAVYGFNMLGDALRDILDPRLQGSQRRPV